jgi:hypothetical protein
MFQLLGFTACGRELTLHNFFDVKKTTKALRRHDILAYGLLTVHNSKKESTYSTCDMIHLTVIPILLTIIIEKGANSESFRLRTNCLFLLLF